MVRHCSHCGKELNDSMKFCAGCGAACVQQEISAKPSKTPGKTKKTPVWVIVIALVAAAAIAGGCLLPGRADTDSPTMPEFVGTGADNTQAAPDTERNIPGDSAETEETQDPFADFETVTLLQSQVFYAKKMGERYTYTYEYDDYGRLIRFCDNREELRVLNEDGYYEYFNPYTDDPDEINGEFVYKTVGAYQYAYTYDEAGTIQEVTVCDEEGKELVCLSASYKNGLPVQYTGEAENGTDIRIDFAYDEKNNLVSSTWYTDNELYTQTQQIYSDTGALLERHYLNDDEDTFVDKFDAEGRLIEQLSDVHTIDYERYAFSYNENGDLCYVSYGYLEYPPDIMELTYDDSGRLTGSCYEAEQAHCRHFYAYTFEGTDTQRTTVKDIEKFGHGYTAEYDQAGNLLKLSFYDESRLMNQVEYTYLEKKVPQGYQKPDIKDPRHLLDLDDIYQDVWECTDAWLSDEFYHVFFEMEHEDLLYTKET